MKSTPDVTVIMAAYNGLPYIERALDSLVSQTIGLENMQVIVVDDGSTDDTPAILDRLAAAHPSFEIIHKPKPNSGGAARGRNLALQHVRGRYIFFLDQDDYLADDTLEATVRMADENGTDVVLARLKGMGGRNTPISLYARTVPRTDVFSSGVYWTLNPMKLFRTEMVRRLDLKFAEDSSWGEDEPFVAMAYLKGNGISILADKDYVFWVYREDRSNISTSVVALADRMPVVNRMFDLVAANVPPGPERDRLMRRHFRSELMLSAFEGYRTEKDSTARRDAFERFRRIVTDYYNPEVERTLLIEGRVLMRLVSEGRQDDFQAYLDVLEKAGTPQVLIEDGHAYLACPWFRDPAKGLPDALFEIGDDLKAECRAEPLSIGAGGIGFSATCRLGELTERVTGVSLVVRPRAGHGDLVVALVHEVVYDGTQYVVLVDDTVSVGSVLGPLSDGTHDLYVRVAAGEIGRERRVAEYAPPPGGPRILRCTDARGRKKLGALRTTSAGNLSLEVSGSTGPVLGMLHRMRRFLGRIVRRVPSGRRA
jgi:glycosyltransferase involved in cell wall biosynthesis